MQDLLMAALTEPVTRLEGCAPNTQRERPRDSGGTQSQQPEQPQRHKGRFVLVINSFIGPGVKESFRRGRSSYGYARQGMKY